MFAARKVLLRALLGSGVFKVSVSATLSRVLVAVLETNVGSYLFPHCARRPTLEALVRNATVCRVTDACHRTVLVVAGFPLHVQKALHVWMVFARSLPVILPAMDAVPPRVFLRIL